MSVKKRERISCCDKSVVLGFGLLNQRLICRSSFWILRIVFHFFVGLRYPLRKVDVYSGERGLSADGDTVCSGVFVCDCDDLWDRAREVWDCWRTFKARKARYPWLSSSVSGAFGSHSVLAEDVFSLWSGCIGRVCPIDRRSSSSAFDCFVIFISLFFCQRVMPRTRCAKLCTTLTRF